MARALVLLNLGTPDSTDVKDVRDYLQEFLSDPRVLDINPIARFLLLHLSILRKRPAESAAAYRKIWTERGSPLLFNGLDLAGKVQELAFTISVNGACVSWCRCFKYKNLAFTT